MRTFLFGLALTALSLIASSAWAADCIEIDTQFSFCPPDDENFADPTELKREMSFSSNWAPSASINQDASALFSNADLMVDVRNPNSEPINLSDAKSQTQAFSVVPTDPSAEPPQDSPPPQPEILPFDPEKPNVTTRVLLDDTFVIKLEDIRSLAPEFMTKQNGKAYILQSRANLTLPSGLTRFSLAFYADELTTPLPYAAADLIYFENKPLSEYLK